MFTEEENESDLKNRRRVSVMIPLFFIAFLWLVQLIQWGMQVDLGWLGIYPHHTEGLIGILFAPLIHGSWSHLISNTIPLFVLGNLMINFYRSISYRVVLWIWLLDGLGVWFIGREAFHIGASGLVYGMASFLLFSGILRKNRQLQALSLIVVFIYGGLIWGMLPAVVDVSWEAHLMGFLSGIFFSVYYLKKGPSNDPLPEWMNEEEEESEMDKEGGKEDGKQDMKITYSFKERKDEDRD